MSVQEKRCCCYRERRPKKDGRVIMSTKEKFQVELLKLVISYHDTHLLKTEEMVEVLKEMVTDAEVAMQTRTSQGDDWFDEWMNRQAS